MPERKFDLEDRLIEFAVMIIRISDNLPNSKAGNNLANQISRSGTSPALNYGEAQGAESKNDFNHKMKVCLKELRETQICLKIIKRAGMYKEVDFLEVTIKECSELVAIFQTSVNTSRANSLR